MFIWVPVHKTIVGKYCVIESQFHRLVLQIILARLSEDLSDLLCGSIKAKDKYISNSI